MPTKRLNEQVKRNADRFPGDFMFQINAAEKAERLALSQDTFSRHTRARLKQVFEALRELMTPPDPPSRSIGFVEPEDTGKKWHARRTS